MRSRSLAVCLLAVACTRAHAQPQRPSAAPVQPPATPPVPTPPPSASTGQEGRFPSFPAVPRGVASDAFNHTWGDGRAELTGYRAIVPRYGERRVGELVLVYVTEPMSRRTWIKDDDATGDDRINVLKLNFSLKFTTGIYPYSVLTSVFSPVDAWRPERFAPVKITLSVQEWCGHVFHGVWPGEDHLTSQIFSYFASEGESRSDVAVRPGTLYEDALFIQLRELDGPFAGGGAWRGELVPSLWRTRRAHQPLAPVAATITRSDARVGGQTVHRFELRYADFVRTLDVEASGAHRILGWTSNDGEDVRLTRTERLPYWSMHRNEDLGARAQIGLEVPRNELPPAPAGQVIGR